MTLASALACAAPAAAQAPAAASPSQRTGLHAGASIAVMRVSFDDRDAETKAGWKLEAGVRIAGDKALLRNVHFTPKFFLTSTDLRGMDTSDPDDFAFASVGIAVRATAGRARAGMKPYIEGAYDKHTAERMDQNLRILNYDGTGVSFGAGIEVPCRTSTSGRGFELGVLVSTSRFTGFEYKKDQGGDADLGHRSIIVSLGWSGRFTGISVPWH